jgi:hypothetical protein
MLEGLSEEDRAAIQAAMAEMEMDDAEAREAGGVTRYILLTVTVQASL